MEDELQKYIEDIIFPKICADGGWVEFDSFEDHRLVLIFKGECSKCQILRRCTDWIESEIKRDLKIDVKIDSILKKPYFLEI